MVSLAHGILRARHDAEDAAQEALIRFFRKIPALGSEREVRAYLCRLAINEARRLRLRRWLRLRADDVDPEAAAPPSPPSQGAAAEYLQIFELVHDLVPRLSRRERQVFLMRAFEEMEYAEIASILEISEITVRRLYSLGRQRMVVLLKKLHGLRLDFPE